MRETRCVEESGVKSARGKAAPVARQTYDCIKKKKKVLYSQFLLLYSNLPAQLSYFSFIYTEPCQDTDYGVILSDIEQLWVFFLLTAVFSPGSSSVTKTDGDKNLLLLITAVMRGPPKWIPYDRHQCGVPINKGKPCAWWKTKQQAVSGHVVCVLQVLILWL